MSEYDDLLDEGWEKKAAEKNLPPEIFTDELSEPEKEVVAEVVEARPFSPNREERMKTDLDWLARRAGKKK